MVIEVRLDALSWFWILMGAAVPPFASILVAYPFWRQGSIIFGNIVGTAVVFGTAFGLIPREASTLDRMTQECLAIGLTCFPEPAAFTRFAIYAFVGLFEVFALFSVSLMFERRARRRDYSPQWR